MRLLTKAGLGLAILLVSIAIAPAAKADPITIQSSNFALQGLGNNGTIANGLDNLIGAAASSSHNVNGAGSFIAILNPLTFTTGPTGIGSGGSYLFNFSQLLTINGQTQTLNIAGSIDISATVDTVHILSSAPLTFNFTTFSVDVNVLPADIVGPGADGGIFSDVLKAEFTVMPSDCNPVPEPATLSLLGLGLAGVAAKLRQRRKQLRS
ncbi:MAG TPA: PEP-CTERM sorting domain-containing protein [Pyrinomonadaceae bacterium]|nr:PEP-CTERM sorting domain-containing protein [Pyrinomonadaceae bacterium]